MKNLRRTNPSYWISLLRIMLGVIFLMTGVMKITMAEYNAAWSIQLIESHIPFYSFNYWFVPVFEASLGLVLMIGYYSRIAAFLTLPIMLVAIYVHLTVINPAAFPSQPQEPVIPIIIIILAGIILVQGGGKWSIDLNKPACCAKS